MNQQASEFKSSDALLRDGWVASVPRRWKHSWINEEEPHKAAPQDDHEIGSSAFPESNLAGFHTTPFDPHIISHEGWSVKADAPSKPPKYEPAAKRSRRPGAPHCGSCKMYNKGHCWGYGNRPVAEDYVCDSYSPSSHKRQAVTTGSTYDAEHPLGELAARHPNVDLFATEHPEGIRLKMIQVAPENQRQGCASAALQDLLAYADQRGLPVALNPGEVEDRPGMSKSQLTNWYRALGFIPNRGRNKDYIFTEAMIRPASDNSQQDQDDRGVNSSIQIQDNVKLDSDNNGKSENVFANFSDELDWQVGILNDDGWNQTPQQVGTTNSDSKEIRRKGDSAFVSGGHRPTGSLQQMEGAMWTMPLSNNGQVSDRPHYLPNAGRSTLLRQPSDSSSGLPLSQDFPRETSSSQSHKRRSYPRVAKGELLEGKRGEERTQFNRARDSSLSGCPAFSRAKREDKEVVRDGEQFCFRPSRSSASQNGASRSDGEGTDLGWHFAAEPDELFIALNVPKPTAEKIRKWVDEQDWPEGTELEEPSEYHITLLYAPKGHKEHREKEWWATDNSDGVRINGIEEFPSQERGELNAFVLRVDTHDDEIKYRTENLLDKAEDEGVEVKRFDGGSKPHITIAYGPKLPKGLKPPEFLFSTDEAHCGKPRTSKIQESPNEAHISQNDATNYEDYRMVDRGDKDNNYDRQKQDSQVDAGDKLLSSHEWSLDIAECPAENNAYNNSETPSQNSIPTTSNYRDGYNAPHTEDNKGSDDEFGYKFLDWHLPSSKALTGEANANRDGSAKTSAQHYEKQSSNDIESGGWTFNGHLDLTYEKKHGNRIADFNVAVPPTTPNQGDGLASPAQQSGGPSLSNVAHNLHYKYQQSGLDPSSAQLYASRLLQASGYQQPDQPTIEAAIEAWKTMYPEDARSVYSLPGEHSIEATPSLAPASYTAIGKSSRSLEWDSLPSNYDTEIDYPEHHASMEKKTAFSAEQSIGNQSKRSEIAKQSYHIQRQANHEEHGWSIANEWRLASDPQFMYHAAPISARVAIEEQGLTKGTITENEREAREHGETYYGPNGIMSNEGYDLWQVDPSESQLRPDWDYTKAGIPGAWEFDVVPPHRLKRIAEPPTANQKISSEPQINEEDWPFMREGCGDYAQALHACDPSLRYGMSYNDIDEEGEKVLDPVHVFVHDGQHAYDAQGRHPLPYNPFGADHIEYDVDPRDVEAANFRQESGDEDPYDHIARRHPQYAGHAALAQAGFDPSQAPQEVLDYLADENAPKNEELQARYPQYFRTSKYAGFVWTDSKGNEHGGSGWIADSWEQKTGADDTFLSELEPVHHKDADDWMSVEAVHPVHGPIAGMQYRIDPENSIEIGNMETEPEFERRGVMTWIMKHLQDKYNAQAFHSVSWTKPGEEWARGYQEQNSPKIPSRGSKSLSNPSRQSPIQAHARIGESDKSERVNPLEELSQFLKQADSWDTRQWPDPLSELGPQPNSPKNCTCKHGDKLHCPVHGLEANGEVDSMEWSLPENSPVGYPQDQPRNWTQAVSSTTSDPKAKAHEDKSGNSDNGFLHSSLDRIDHKTKGENQHTGKLTKDKQWINASANNTSDSTNAQGNSFPNSRRHAHSIADDSASPTDSHIHSFTHSPLPKTRPSFRELPAFRRIRQSIDISENDFDNGWYSSSDQNWYHPSGPIFDGTSDGDLFHVTPTEDRQRVMSHGLQVSDPGLETDRKRQGEQPMGVYGWESPDLARQWGWWRSGETEDNPWSRGYDIWRIPAEQIRERLEDRIWGAGASVIPHTVYPVLYEGPEHRQAGSYKKEAVEPPIDVKWYGEPSYRGDHSLIFDPSTRTLHIGDSDYHHWSLIEEGAPREGYMGAVNDGAYEGYTGPTEAHRPAYEHMNGLHQQVFGTPLPWDKDTWGMYGYKEVTAAISVHEVPGSEEGREWHGDRKPLVYFPNEQKLWLGSPGSSHYDLTKAPGFNLSDYVSDDSDSGYGGLYTDPQGKKVVEFYSGTPESEHIQNILKALGADRAQLNEWHPGEEVHDNPDMQWDFNSSIHEAVTDALEGPTDAELQNIEDSQPQDGNGIIEVPWEPGLHGKGIYWPHLDHLETWADPRHHVDVWRERPGEAHALGISPTGEVLHEGSFGSEENNTPLEDISEALRRHDSRLSPQGMNSEHEWAFAKVAHRLSWQPGEYGKGLIHDGEIHTWGVGQEDDARPTHPEYATENLTLPEDEHAYINSPTWGTAFQIDPEGRVNVYEPEKAQEIGQQVEAADPRLKVNYNHDYDWAEPMRTEPDSEDEKRLHNVEISNNEPGVPTVDA